LTTDGFYFERRKEKIHEENSADENLRRVRKTDGVAQALGKSLDGSKILFGTMQKKQRKFSRG